MCPHFFLFNIWEWQLSSGAKQSGCVQVHGTQSAVPAGGHHSPLPQTPLAVPAGGQQSPLATAGSARTWSPPPPPLAASAGAPRSLPPGCPPALPPPPVQPRLPSRRGHAPFMVQFEAGSQEERLKVFYFPLQAGLAVTVNGRAGEEKVK